MNEIEFKKHFSTAVNQFNRHHFFECHDTLEDLWMEIRTSERLFFQGLLHVAVGFYHFENRNFKGCFSQLSKAEQKLSRFPDGYRGVGLTSLLTGASRIKNLAAAQLQRAQAHSELVPFPQLQWIPERFFDTTAVQANIKRIGA